MEALQPSKQIPLHLKDEWSFRAKTVTPKKRIPFINSASAIVLIFVAGFSNLQGSFESLELNSQKGITFGPSQPYKPGSIKSQLFKRGQVVWVASKAARSLSVYRFDGNRWIKKHCFPLIYGSREGNKLKLGDLKTPEGNYWVNNIFNGYTRAEKFGSMVFSLNYPNKTDREEGKTGGGIWIHGHKIGTDLTSTRGCLKLSNKDMVKLFSYCRGPIPVKILSNNQLMSDPNHLDMSWVAEDYPKWKRAFNTSQLTNPDRRNLLFRNALNFLEKERDFLFPKG